MKKIFLYLFIIFLAGGITLFFKNGSKVDLSQHDHDEAALYTCPMHPEVREHKKGKCPICHMDLVKADSEKSESSLLSFSEENLKTLGYKKFEIKKEVKEREIPIKGRFIAQNRIAFQIFESDLGLIKKGLSFIGTPVSKRDQFVTGEILSIDTYADPNSRTIRVVGILHENLQGIPLESSFSGTLYSEEKKGIFIPIDTILRTGKKDLVFKFEDERHVKAQAINLGSKYGEFYEVISGLNLGDKISHGANFFFDSEMRIRGIRD